MTERRLKVRWTGNQEWTTIGTAERPFNLRCPGGTWQVFGDGIFGNPLKVRMPNGRWQRVSRTGIAPKTPTVWGIVTDLDLKPLKNKLVTLRGPIVRSTRTNDKGQYLFADLTLGGYTVTVDVAAAPRQQGTVTLPQAEPVAMLNFMFDRLRLPIAYPVPFNRPGYTGNPGWLATEDSNLESDADWLDIGTHTAGSPMAYLAARSYSGMGWIGNENNNYLRRTIKETSWLPIPPASLMLNAAEYIARTGPLATNYQDPVLERTQAVFQLRGHSVVKNQVEWMNWYLRGETTTGPHTGNGHLIYTGLANTNLGTVINWNAQGAAAPTDPPAFIFFSPTRAVTVPIIRDRAFGHYDGLPVWEGSLNELGTDVHGMQRPTKTVTFDISPTLSDVAIEFQMFVDDTPEPPEIDKSTNIAFDNVMEAQAFVEFTYRFW